MSGSSGYYDMESILSEEERVPCIFTLDAVGMGMLDPTTSEEDLAQGTKARIILLNWYMTRATILCYISVGSAQYVVLL